MKSTSSTFQVLCPICTDLFPLDQMLILHCGHGFCIKCTTAVKEKCWVCRTPLAGIEPHRIYLDTERRDAVVDGLNKIDLDAPAASVAKAGGKIQRLLKKPDPELLQAVLDAKTDMEERITPMFEKWEALRAENDKLLNKLNDAKSRIEKEKQRVVRAQKALDSAQEETKRYTDRLAEYKAHMNAKDRAISDLEAAQELKDKQLNLANKKLKALAKLDKDKKRRRQSHDGDASLQIEKDGPTESETSKRQKRSVS